MSPKGAGKVYPAYLIAAEELRKNLEQWQVYESRGHCVVLAGPGSGKTKVLTIKMARMLAEDIRPPRGIACITYNTECARELKRRLDRLGVSETRNVFIGTIHSFCLKNILIPYGRLAGLKFPEPLKVASQNVQDIIFEQILYQSIKTNDPPTTWRTKADWYRRTFLDRDAPEWREGDGLLADLIEKYEQKLHTEGFIDFDDMVLWGLKLIEKHEWVRKLIKARFPILVVDEYQDLGIPFHRMVLNLCFGSGVRLLAVGDPDQSIYGFTGAKPELLLELSKMEGVELVRLRLNYRCGKTIVRASQVALGENRDYDTPPDAQQGVIDFYECHDGIEHQAEVICSEILPSSLSKNGHKPGDIAVLYLDKNDGDIIADKVTKTGMPFIRIDKNAPYAKTQLIQWLEDCAAWCSGGWKEGKPRLSSLIKAWVAFNKNAYSDETIVPLKRQLVKFLWSHRAPDAPLRDWLEAFNSFLLHPLFEHQPELHHEQDAFNRLMTACSKGGTIADFNVATFAGQGGSPDHLNLITLYSAKGSEFEEVILMGMEHGRIPRIRAGIEEKREQRRLFYVGLTRAKHGVHITYSGWYSRYGKFYQLGPSEFVVELKNSLEEDRQTMVK